MKVGFFRRLSALLGVGLVCRVGFLVGQTLTIQFLGDGLLAHAESPTKDQAAERFDDLERFNSVLKFIEQYYVDKIEHKKLIEGAIKGMLETLDPHSNFLSAEVYKDMQIDTSGKFGGLGIEIGMKDNILTILAPIEDTPAWKAGLKPNDRIVKINRESTKGMTLVETVSKMRGKPKTPVTLSIYREGLEKIKDVTITRDVIKIQAVKTEMLDAEYGYVRLTTFNENAAADVKRAIDEMKKKGKLSGLVFDMRMNPGGLLDQAVEVTSLFVNEGVVVSTIGRTKDQKEVKNVHKGKAFLDLPMIVLVNSSSASAAEIVAGALQDHHRAIIMGQPTFGKGSVQTVIPLPPDQGLKLTIARYFTPSGKSIQETGVKPDILLDEYDPKLLAQAKLKGEPFRERDLKGHMVNPEEEEKKPDFKQEELEVDKKKKDSKEDDEFVPIRMNPKEDYQVRQALGLLKSHETFKQVLSAESKTK